MTEYDVETRLFLSMLKDGDYWKHNGSTFIVEERKYPHDEGCEGMFCWCKSRAKHKLKDNFQPNSKKEFIKVVKEETQEKWEDSLRSESKGIPHLKVEALK